MEACQHSTMAKWLHGGVTAWLHHGSIPGQHAGKLSSNFFLSVLSPAKPG